MRFTVPIKASFLCFTLALLSSVSGKSVARQSQTTVIDIDSDLEQHGWTTEDCTYGEKYDEFSCDGTNVTVIGDHPGSGFWMSCTTKVYGCKLTLKKQPIHSRLTGLKLEGFIQGNSLLYVVIHYANPVFAQGLQFTEGITEIDFSKYGFSDEVTTIFVYPYSRDDAYAGVSMINKMTLYWE